MKESSKSRFGSSSNRSFSFSSMLQEDHYKNNTITSSSSSSMVTNISSSNNATSMYESNLKQNGKLVKNKNSGTTNILGTNGVDVLSTSQPISGNMHNRNHLRPDIIVTSNGGGSNVGKGCSSSSTELHRHHHVHHGNGPMANSHKTSMMVMHNSATMMDIKSLQKSTSFTSSLSSGGLKIGSWFDRRARKISMKCSKSMTLGKKHFLEYNI